LAHARRSFSERAFVGADLHLRRANLIDPTVKQSAQLAGVCGPYVVAALAITRAEIGQTIRDAVIAGELGLLEAVKAIKAESLAAQFCSYNA
jgi:hypothetical protein